MSNKLPHEVGFKSMRWNARIISVDPYAQYYPHIVPIEADPETYELPEEYRNRYRQLKLGANTLWCANMDHFMGKSWRGETSINLAEPGAVHLVLNAIMNLKTMRGQRHLLFTEQDESVPIDCTPDAVDLYIQGQDATPTSFLAVSDIKSDDWRILSGIAADTTLLIDNISPRLRAFTPPII